MTVELWAFPAVRPAKYRGLAKVKRQNYFIGAACNVKRWLRREAWRIQQALLLGTSVTTVPAAH